MSLYDYLHAIIDRAELPEPADGIAKKIAAEGGIEGLSEKQLYHYHKHIEPFMNKPCSSFDCENEATYYTLTMSANIVDNIDHISGYCEHCQYINEVNARDD